MAIGPGLAYQKTDRSAGTGRVVLLPKKMQSPWSEFSTSDECPTKIPGQKPPKTKPLYFY